MARRIDIVFIFLDLKKQLTKEKKRTEKLQEQIKDLENASIELAKIIVLNEERINNG
jgi:hypothetical protein